MTHPYRSAPYQNPGLKL